MDKSKTLKIALALTYIFLFLLIVVAIALPMLVTWYVEIKGRHASLPTTILVTCYPCAPFTAAILIYVKNLIKNALQDNILDESSVGYLKRISLCSLVISLITLFAGRYYLPFYIVGATFAFLALLVFAFRGIFITAKEKLNMK